MTGKARRIRIGFTAANCPFCNIAAGQGKTKIYYQDDLIVAFHDRLPAGQMHLQVIPREHIRHIGHLEARHIPLLEHMRREGERLVKEQYPDAECIFGFHFPPSIGHLHLHCIVLPFLPSARVSKYTEDLPLWQPYDGVLLNVKRLSAGS